MVRKKSLKMFKYREKDTMIMKKKENNTHTYILKHSIFKEQKANML